MKQRYKVGKHPDNDIECIGSYVNDFHAEIYWKADAWWIEDKGSTFYTFVNNHQIEAATKITKSDQIRLGSEILHWWDEVNDIDDDDPFYFSELWQWKGTISKANYLMVLALLIVMLGALYILSSGNWTSVPKGGFVLTLLFNSLWYIGAALGGGIFLLQTIRLARGLGQP